MLKLDPDSEMDSDPDVDSDPAWIQIHAIPIPAHFDVIPAPDLDPQKSGIITPLVMIIMAASDAPARHHSSQLSDRSSRTRSRSR